MGEFRFLHAADLHLDSPLLGLRVKSDDFARRVERASRGAFDRLVALAIDKRCRFVVLAGDVFDGDLRDYASGLFFMAGVSRLVQMGIKVFLVAGNHDAENRFFAKLALSRDVTFFDHAVAGHVVLDDVGAVVHGRSFGQREVTENIALTYGSPHRSLFNVGILHTACVGSEGHHAPYAPCTLEQLVNHGYEYWALGHVHSRAMLSQHPHPHVVYPGNLQGRNPREVGPKGATIVEVAGGEVVSCTHHDLDEVRWASAEVHIGGLVDKRAVLDRARGVLADVGASAGGRPVALRLAVVGRTQLHGDLVSTRADLREDLEAIVETMTDEVWLEKLELRTTPDRAGDACDPTISGRLGTEIRRLAAEPGFSDLLERSLAEVRAKLPAAAGADDLIARVREEAPERGLELALSLIGRHAA